VVGWFSEVNLGSDATPEDEASVINHRVRGYSVLDIGPHFFVGKFFWPVARHGAGARRYTMVAARPHEDCHGSYDVATYATMRQKEDEVSSQIEYRQEKPTSKNLHSHFRLARAELSS
jgi:hypothetical protein